MGVGGKKKGIRILPIYYSNHSSTNDDLLSTTIPTRGKLRHSLVIIQTFLLFWLFVDETNSIRQLDRWINFTDFSLLFFSLYSFLESKGTPARRNKNRCCRRLAEQGRCKDDYHDDVAASLAPGNFREERRERVYAGGEEEDTKGEGAWKGLLASTHTRVHVFKRAYPSSPPPFPRNPPV